MSHNEEGNALIKESARTSDPCIKFVASIISLIALAGVFIFMFTIGTVEETGDLDPEQPLNCTVVNVYIRANHFSTRVAVWDVAVGPHNMNGVAIRMSSQDLSDIVAAHPLGSCGTCYAHANTPNAYYWDYSDRTPALAGVIISSIIVLAFFALIIGGLLCIGVCYCVSH